MNRLSSKLPGTASSPLGRSVVRRITAVFVGTASVLVGMAIASQASAATIMVTDFADSWVRDDAKCSLAEAIFVANYDIQNDSGCGSAAGWDTVVLQAGTYTISQRIDVNDDVEVVVKDNLRATIKPASGATNMGFVIGAGLNVYASNLTFDGFRDTALHIRGGAFAWIEGLQVLNGVGPGAITQGASVVVEKFANLTLSSAYIYNNKRSLKGGGILVSSNGVLTLHNSTVSRNEASQYGGGVHVMSGATFNCYSSSITSNKAGIRGGGVYLSTDASRDLQGCDISGNTAPSDPNISGL